MNQNDYEEARCLYKKYRAGQFSMKKEGEYDRYAAFNVPSDVEEKWREEMKEEYIKKLETEVRRDLIEAYYGALCDLLPMFSQDIDLRYYLLQFIDNRKSQLDSFTLLLIAEKLLRGVEKHKWNATPDVRKRAKTVGMRVLEELLVNPITVADEYRQLKYLSDDTLSDEALLRRAKADIRHFRDV